MKPIMHILKGQICFNKHYLGNYFMILQDIKGRLTSCHVPMESINEFLSRKNSEIKQGKEIVVKGATDINIFGNEVFYVDQIVSCRDSRNISRSFTETFWI